MHDPSLAAYKAGLYVLAYLLGAKDVGHHFQQARDRDRRVLGRILERGAYPVRWERGFL